MEGPIPLPRRRGPAVLVVEDDPNLGRLVERMLGQFTEHVTLAHTGRAALEALSKGHHGAIAADISLPDMSGLDVIAEARLLAPAAGIVAITGFVDVDVAVQAMKAGADDFLGKPFDPEMLWHVLNKAAGHRARMIEAEQAAVYRKLAYTDALTGAPNRRFLDEHLGLAVSAARLNGDPLTIAYMDIDNFKLLNDFVGHIQGDEVLIRVADALRAEIAEPAVFARFGGDEFVIVFPGEAVAQARRALEAVRRTISGLGVVNGSQITLPIRVSCGFAALRGDESPRDLIAEAEEQMYLDKAATPAIVTGATNGSLHPAVNVKVANLKALRSLVKAIDRRDSYTRFHSDHATHLALQMARRLGLPEEHVNALTIGGPIHDLGKIVVPDEILRKPGPLTSHERRNMEEHPVMGAAITAAVMDYDTVVELVRHHHERFDGEGYPARLRAEEISLPTRIFTLADAYSAMTTDRPYRKGLTIEQAVDQIERGAGTQFDPDLAREFVTMLTGEDLARKSAA